MAYDTQLTGNEEADFYKWKQQYAPNDSGLDYDLRGAFKAGIKPNPKTGHWPDTYKKPNHPTFSVESKYAKDAPDKAGKWSGETYIPAKAMSRTDTFSDALDIIGPVKKTPLELDVLEESTLPPEVKGEKLTQRREDKYTAENREPGIPLDTQSGLDAGTRAKMSFERDPNKRMEWLAQQPGIEGVRQTKSGDGIIARVKGEDGTMRDILVDERRTTLKDFADITGDLPQMAVAALTAYFTGGMGLLGQSATVAGASAIEGAAQDAAIRKASGRDVDPAEIAKARGMQAAIDTAIPMGPGAAKRLAQTVVGPFSKGVGALERGAAEAAVRQNVPMKASQLTGSKALARVETFTENLPLGGPLVDQTKAQDEAINRVREYLMGGKAGAVPTSQEIGDRASSVLADKRLGEEAMLANKRRATEGESQKSIERLLEQNLPGGAITPSEAGSAVRSKVVAMRDTFKAKANELYGKVYALPGAEDPFVPSTPIKALVEDIKGKSTEATQQLLPEIKRIFKVGETIPDKMTLRQAVELRSVIGDMVGRPEALSGLPTGYIKRLYGAASEAIEQGVATAPNKDIGVALSDAQKHFKENHWKFEQPGVAELFGEVAQGKGFKVGDSQVARRLTSGGGDVDQLKVMREMLGANSPEFKGLLRSSINEMIQDASFGEKYVNAGEFLSRLKSMSPEFRKEAIGPIEKELVGDAKVMELLQSRKIDPLEMDRILNSRPGKVASTVRDIVEEQAAMDKYYGSALMRQLTDGRFNPATFNADDFVTRFVDNASAQDLRQVMTQLRAADPELPDMIKRRAMADLLNRVSGEVKPEQAIAGEIGSFDYKKLIESLSGPTGEKYKSILGSDAIETLKDLTTIETARSKAASMGKQSGQLVYSNILAALMDFKLSEIPRIAKNRLLAGMLTTPGLKAWLTSQVKIPATPTARASVMSSPPVIRAILSEFSDEPDLAGQIIEAIKSESDSTDEEKAPTGKDLIEGKR